METKIKHPAVYSDQFLSIFYKYIKDTSSVFDPFAGTGKIGFLKSIGYNGVIICNDLEPEYSAINSYNVDIWLHEDAEFVKPKEVIDAIVTSPTYGNRMADSHNAKDASKRITYTHQLGRKLTEGNTGSMQWGEKYKNKHLACYKNFYDLLRDRGVFVLNISDHIRSGKIIPVSQWHFDTLISIGFEHIETLKIPVKRMRYGQNSNLRIETENIMIFIKR